MELSPQAVAAATFKTVKRGYDPDEVRAYLLDVAAGLEASHQQATAMEARARAAIAKLQDATQYPGQAPAMLASGEAETISRTLVLAQRTADTTVAEALAQAATITASAQAEAANELAQARAEAAHALDEARAAARRSKDDEQLRVENEVRDLHVRRAALLVDLDRLETHVTAHRERLRDVASALASLADKVPADGARPMMTATMTAPPPADNGDDSGSMLAPPITGQHPITPGREPLVSPRPTTAAQARSMWNDAELSDHAEFAGSALIDATPPDGAAVSFAAPTSNRSSESV